MAVLCFIRKSIALHAPGDDNVRKQSTIPLAMEEDYPDVVASLQLNENQAYGNRNLNSTRGVKETKFSADEVFDSSLSFIEIKGKCMLHSTYYHKIKPAVYDSLVNSPPPQIPFV